MIIDLVDAYYNNSTKDAKRLLELGINPFKKSTTGNDFIVEILLDYNLHFFLEIYPYLEKCTFKPENDTDPELIDIILQIHSKKNIDIYYLISLFNDIGYAFKITHFRV